VLDRVVQELARLDNEDLQRTDVAAEAAAYVLDSARSTSVKGTGRFYVAGLAAPRETLALSSNAILRPLRGAELRTERVVSGTGALRWTRHGTAELSSSSPPHRTRTLTGALRGERCCWCCRLWRTRMWPLGARMDELGMVGA